jgi:DNA-binding CsgD family transcriptional regulator
MSEAPPQPRVADASTLALAADALACAMLLLDAGARVLHANLTGRELLSPGGPLALDGDGRLRAADPARRAALDEALRTANAGRAARLAWNDGAPLAATLTRLDPDPHGPSPSGPPPLLLMASAPPGTPLDGSGFAAAHGLTEAELRVLEQLMRGRSAVEAAAALGLGLPTVRSHVAAIRRKTGQHSVAALLALLATLPPLRRR